MVEVRHLLIVSLGLMTAMAFNYAFADTTNFTTSLTFHDTTSNTDRLIISNNGFVGIGVSPTTVMVDVKSPTNAGYRLQADNGVASQSVVSTGGNAQFRLRDLDFGKTFDIRLIDNTGRLEVFDTALGSARIVVTTTGDVGIGTITPLAKLDVAGNIRLTGNIISPNDICIGACP
jgi:hypothetical protein